jgi:hypothetical protein
MKKRLSNYSRCLIAVVVSYLILYGALLLYTRGLPYVCDNNESFSSLCHAYNLYHFDFWKSYGLTDEACSPHAEAHPYVHTHQGNFPRLFSFLIYLLGARGIESQIIVTTFTIGLITILFAYHFFARLVTPLFGLCTCLLLMSDYVMFAQWHVNTYRVWHGFFVFSSLFCVQGLGGRCPRTWRWLTLVNFLGLFYYELVFVLFVSLTSLLYALHLYRRSPRVVLGGLLWGGTGAVIALGILFVQLTAYMGVDNVLQDARLTIRSRQFTANDQAAPPEVLAFYRAHHIAFFPNFVDGRQFLGVRAFVCSLFTYNLTAYTPLFSLLLITVALGWLQGALWNSRAGRWLVLASTLPVGPSNRAPRPGKMYGLPTAFKIVTLVGCSARFVVDLARGWVSPEVLGAGSWRQAAGALMIAAGFTLVVTWLATGRWRGFARMSAVKVLSVGMTLLFLAWMIRHQGALFDQPKFAPIWQDLTHPWYLKLWTYLAMLTAAGIMAVLVIEPTRIIDRKSLASVGRLLPFLLCGAAAYGVVYVLAGGYLHSGYLHRWLSFLVFFTMAGLASGAYLVLQLLLGGVRLLQQSGRTLIDALTATVMGATRRLRVRAVGTLGGLVLPTLGTAALLGWTMSFWVRLQSLYLVLLPPTHYEVLRLLRQPPYAGISFAVNTYATPIGWTTGEWAICTPQLANADGQLKTEACTAASDLTFLWLADATTNPAYRQPHYYLAVNQQGLETVVPRLARQRGLAPPLPEIRSGPISQSSPDLPPPLNHRILAGDPTGLGRWMIVELDWDVAPYLAPLEDQDHSPSGHPPQRVRLQVEEDPEGPLVTVLYCFAHQEHKPEAGSVVMLDGLDQTVSPERLQTQPGRVVFRLPPSFAGNVRASVIPRTATRSGAKSWSNSVRIGAAPSLRRPYLEVGLGSKEPSRVKASLCQEGGRDVIRVWYLYRHDENEREVNSMLRVYLESSDKGRRLLTEAKGAKVIPFPGQQVRLLAQPGDCLRVSVTPRTVVASGDEYFSAERFPIPCLDRPSLRLLDSEKTDKHVLVQKAGNAAAALQVIYTYQQPQGLKESGTIIRLYVEEANRQLRLIREEKDVKTVHLEPGFAAPVRISVTPRAGSVSGPEYFSETLDLTK